MREVTIAIPSSTEFAGPVVKFFDAFFFEKGITAQISTNVTTSVLEAIGNAITHGNQGDIDKKIQISIKIDGAKIRIEIQDEGSGFDATSLPDPLAPENLLKPSGRGIFFMKSLMDHVHFHSNGSGSRVIMEKVFRQHLE